MRAWQNSSFVSVAVGVARRAGKLLLEKQGQLHQVEFKGVTDLVTEADKSSEALICTALLEAFPDHAILGEEGGRRGHAASEYLWVIDPLDGTTNFVHGFPNFAVSIGLEQNGEVVAGVVYAPAFDQLYAAERGAGAYLGDARLQVAETEELQQGLVATGFPYDLDLRPTAVRRVAAVLPLVRDIRRLGAAALDMANVAQGRFAAYWEAPIRPWDICAGSLLVTEAGGTVTDLTGGTFRSSKEEVVASNGRIHTALMAALARV